MEILGWLILCGFIVASLSGIGCVITYLTESKLNETAFVVLSFMGIFIFFVSSFCLDVTIILNKEYIDPIHWLAWGSLISLGVCIVGIITLSYSNIDEITKENVFEVIVCIITTLASSLFIGFNFGISLFYTVL